MLVTSRANSLTTLHPNINIALIDETVIKDDTQKNPDLPRFNMLIPIVVDRGLTNTMEIFYPNEPNRFILNHGKPDILKYGIGPNLIHSILGSGADIGVYTVNLRGDDATMANLIVSLKYRIEEAVPYTDASGNPYYISYDDMGNRVLTFDPGIDNQPVVRDVLHVKYVSSFVEECKSWVDVHTAMNNMATDMEDEDGYLTLPWFSVMNIGSGSYGNDVYFSMHPRVSDSDDCIYYSIHMFDGMSASKTDSMISMDMNAGAKYGANYYIEYVFNNTYSTLRFMSSDVSDTITNLFKSHLYTLDDILNGTDPTTTFQQIDPFSIEEFGIVMDNGSIDVTDVKAFQLRGGENGEMDRDALFEKFFNGEIIPDIKSPLRYRMSYIPDLQYNDQTKHKIVEFVEARNHTTTASLMVGGLESFQSAITHRRSDYYGNMPSIRLIAKCQSPMMYDPYVRKMRQFPASYYDTIALVESIRRHGNPYEPFAGANVRWTGYIEDTMKYPEEDPEFIDNMTKARVNCVMKDDQDGAYVSDQLMNVNFESDQIEFNNSILVSDMIYDLVQIIHRNHFTFNESSHITSLKEQVQDYINTRYRPYSASLDVDVYRPGTVGRAGKTRVVEATIDLKDIARFAQIKVRLVDN